MHPYIVYANGIKNYRTALYQRFSRAARRRLLAPAGICIPGMGFIQTHSSFILFKSSSTLMGFLMLSNITSDLKPQIHISDADMQKLRNLAFAAISMPDIADDLLNELDRASVVRDEDTCKYIGIG